MFTHVSVCFEHVCGLAQCDFPFMWWFCLFQIPIHVYDQIRGNNAFDSICTLILALLIKAMTCNYV